MKIVTWNVNGLRAVAQKGLLEFWQQESPDLLCLQETKCHPDQVDFAAIPPKGWSGYWSAAQKAGYSGTATFSKTAAESFRPGIGIKKFDAEGRVVETRFRDFTLLNIYFPNGGSGQERHQFKQEFLRRLAEETNRRIKSGEALIVVGDFNVAYMDTDVYDPKALSKESGFLPEERQWMRNWLESGFIDCYRYIHPDKTDAFTWWAYYENARVSNRGWRIDHICISRNLESRLKSATILDSQEGSDHCPVLVELEGTL
ncbi:MAG: exodeoxyribonuclease III [Bdellovibrionales bacterium]